MWCTSAPARTVARRGAREGEINGGKARDGRVPSRGREGQDRAKRSRRGTVFSDICIVSLRLVAECHTLCCMRLWPSIYQQNQPFALFNPEKNERKKRWACQRYLIKKNQFKSIITTLSLGVKGNGTVSLFCMWPELQPIFLSLTDWEIKKKYSTNIRKNCKSESNGQDDEGKRILLLLSLPEGIECLLTYY